MCFCVPPCGAPTRRCTDFWRFPSNNVTCLVERIALFILYVDYAHDSLNASLFPSAACELASSCVRCAGTVQSFIVCTMCGSRPVHSHSSHRSWRGVSSRTRQEDVGERWHCTANPAPFAPFTQDISKIGRKKTQMIFIRNLPDPGWAPSSC